MCELRRIRIDFVEDAQLFRAVGRVSVESALLDELMREVITELIEGSDYMWILFEGQSTEWLIATVLEILTEMDSHRRIWPDDLHSRFKCIMSGIKKIRPLRNSVIHGNWTYDTPAELTEIASKPWRTIVHNEDVYYCNRSRMRDIEEVREFSISDVDHLADLFMDARMALTATARLMLRVKHDDDNYVSFRRWWS